MKTGKLKKSPKIKKTVEGCLASVQVPHICYTGHYPENSQRAGPGLSYKPDRIMKTRKINFLILSMVLGPSFDPCCHFLGPRKPRQRCMLEQGESVGLGNTFFLELTATAMIC